MQNISLSVDAIVFYRHQGSQKVLLIQRKNPPFQDQWALPGGFVENDEDLQQAAIRELKEETGIEIDNMKQVHAFGSPERDPRQRVVTIAYYSVLSQKPESKAASDAKDAKWFNIDKLPEMAFDHLRILQHTMDLSHAHASNI